MLKSVGAAIATAALSACQSSAPLTKSNLRLSVSSYNASLPATLGLAPAPQQVDVTVYAPTRADDFAYNHGAVLTFFKGRYFIQWQSSLRDEDAPDTRVMYATSADSVNWSAPRVLATSRSDAVVTNGGWRTDGETLVAFLNVWPSAPDIPRHGLTEYLTSLDGNTWSAPFPVLDASGAPIKGVIEQDVRPLNDKRLLTTFHVQPGLIAAPHYTSDLLGRTGWTRGAMKNLLLEGNVSRELEPAWYIAADGAIVMVFRDQSGTHRTLVSVSLDDGESFTPPAYSEFPDSRSKQSAGNLPDGTAFRVNNPRRSRERFPLVLSLSRDGYNFTRAYTLRTGLFDLPPMLFDGKYKRIGYSYPKSYVHDGYLFVAYAANKERIELSRIPVSALRD